MPGRPLRIATAAALTVAAVLPGAALAQDGETLCHFTGSGYTLLTVDSAGLIAHLGHEEDIYPAPEAGCPGATAETPAATATPAYPLVTPTPTPAVEDFPIEGPVDGGDEEILPGGGAPPGAAPDGSGLEPESSRLTPARPLAAGRLPATGDDVRLIGLAGLGLVLSGLGLRLRLRLRLG